MLCGLMFAICDWQVSGWGILGLAVRKHGCAVMRLLCLLWFCFLSSLPHGARETRRRRQGYCEGWGRRVVICGEGEFGICKQATMAEIAFFNLVSKGVGKRGFWSYELGIRNNELAVSGWWG